MDYSALIQSAQQGNLEAFNQLVLAFQDRLFNVAVCMLEDDDSAADALQNAFILAFRKLTSFRGGAFDYWLLRVVKNVCYDELRRRKRQFTYQLEPPEVEEEGFETPIWLVDHSASPAELAEQSELRQAIQQGLNSLPPDYRMVVTLVDIEGLNYSEAARIIGTPIGTVKSRLARARMKLRQELQRYLDILPGQFTQACSRLAVENMALA